MSGLVWGGPFEKDTGSIDNSAAYTCVAARVVFSRLSRGAGSKLAAATGTACVCMYAVAVLWKPPQKLYGTLTLTASEADNR